MAQATTDLSSLSSSDLEDLKNKLLIAKEAERQKSALGIWSDAGKAGSMAIFQTNDIRLLNSRLSEKDAEAYIQPLLKKLNEQAKERVERTKKESRKHDEYLLSGDKFSSQHLSKIILLVIAAVILANFYIWTDLRDKWSKEFRKNFHKKMRIKKKQKLKWQTVMKKLKIKSKSESESDSDSDSNSNNDDDKKKNKSK